MKLRIFGLVLVLGLLLTGCGVEEAPLKEELTDPVIQQSEEMTVPSAEQDEVVVPEDKAQSEQELQTEEETVVESKETVDSDVPEDTTILSIVDGSNLEHQLAVIYENRADWYTTDIEMGSYTVTDLDQNGKLEVLAAVCSGSGMYTYTNIWEVNGDELVHCEQQVSEYDSQVDLIVSETVAYSVDGSWNYIFYDTVRMGAMGYNCDLRSMTLQNGVVIEQTYATLSETTDGANTVLEAATAEGTPLTEDEFYALRENLMDGEKRQATFRWINVFEGEFDLNSASQNEAIAMLSELYTAFTLQ